MAEDIILTALKRFKQVQEAESSTREKCLDDLKFSTGDQWPFNIRAQRERDGKPCLTMDQTQQTTRIVCNEYRQQRPAINVSPIGDGADIDSSEILQGCIRHVEVQSDAEIAYDGCHESVTRIGIGHFRFLTDYVDGESDDQEIYICPIRNAFSVYKQPGVSEDKIKWAFITEDVPREEYKEDYKDSQLATLNDMTATGDTPPEWVTKETIRVAEYFTIEERKGKGKRPKEVVVWRKINAVEVLEGPTDLPGESIPIFTCTGDDIDVDGKRYLAGLIRNAKDPQRMYNYWTSAATEKIALSRTAPWLAVEGTIVNQPAWENPDGLRVLYYKPVDVAGKPAPPPSRELLEPAIDSMEAMTRQAQGDVKSSMGVYDPSLGQHKGDQSGKAIEKLQAQGSLATLNFSDNMARTMRRAGKELINWMRYYWDTPKIRRIIMPDGSSQLIAMHNGEEQAGDAQNLLDDKITKAFDIGVGRYDVTVSVGPSYQTKRQESVATQLEFLKLLPPGMAQNFIDLVTANMDWPQAQEFAKRAKKLLPPQLQDDNGSPEAQLAKVEATNKQLAQQHQLLTQALQEAQKVIETKQIEQQGKVQIAQTQELSKQTIVKMQEATKLAVAQINASKDLQQSFAEQELKQYDLLHSDAHELAMQNDQQAHERDISATQAANAQQTQAANQQHDMAMAAQSSDNEA